MNPGLPSVNPGWRGRARWENLALALTAWAIWRWRFGPYGARLDADTAVQAGMVLGPFDRHFVYYWGQLRTGSIVPLLGKLFRALGGGSALAAAQTAVYFCDALGLFLLLGLVRSLPFKLPLWAFLVFPAYVLAETLLAPGPPIPGLLLFAGVELQLFAATRRGAAAPQYGLLGLTCGLLWWAGEPGLILLPPQLALALGRWRQGERLAPTKGWAFLGGLLGGSAPAVLVRFWLSYPGDARYRRLLHVGEAVASLAQSGPQLGAVFPLLGGGVVWLAALALAAASAALSVAELRRPRRSDEPLVTLGAAPLLGIVAVACSRWFLINGRAPRYFVFPLCLLVLAGSLGLERLWERWSAGWSRQPARAIVGCLSVALALAIALFDGRDGTAGLPGIPPWFDRARQLADWGCQGVVADYWDSYPYLAVSDGQLLATPHDRETDVRNRSLARAAVRRPTVCALPWWTAPGCPAELSEFEATLRLQDEQVTTVDGASLRACRYHPDPDRGSSSGPPGG